MLAKPHRVLGIVTDRQPATAQQTFGKPPNMGRQAWTRLLHRLLLVDPDFGGA